MQDEKRELDSSEVSRVFKQRGRSTHCFRGGAILKKIAFLGQALGVILCLAPVLQAQFSSPSVNISNSGTDSLLPRISHIIGGTTELAIWLEESGDTDYLMFSKSTNMAQTWSTPVYLTGNGQIRTGDILTDDYCFSFCVDNPYVHVVMQWRSSAATDFEIWYIRSTDLGDTWDAWVQLTNNTTNSRFPDVDVRGEYVHVCYQDSWPGNEDIMYKRITNYGAGGVDQTRRLTFATTDAYYPRIAVSQSGITVNIVYQDAWNGHWNIFYKYIPSYGAGSYQTRQLTFNSTDYNGRPDIVFGWDSYEQYVYIVYETDWPGNMDIMYKRLGNYGGAGGTIYTARLTYSATESRTCTIDFDTAYGYVHVAYNDLWPGNNDVMHKEFTVGGGAGFATQRVSWGTGDSSHACVAASGTWAYIAWMDDSTGNYEILVKRGN